MFLTLKGASPYKLQITNLDLPNSKLDVYLEVMADPGVPASGLVVRGAAYEDGVRDSTEVHDRVVRDVLTPVPVTVSNVGETMSFTMPVDTSGFSNLSKGGAAVFVQEGASGPIHQANCTAGSLTYGLNFYSGRRAYMVPSPSVLYTEDVVVFNQGTATDTFRARLVTVSAPAGWIAELSDGVATDPSELTVTMAPGDLHRVHLNVTVNSPGSGRYSVELSQGGRPANIYPISFAVLTQGLPILVVYDAPDGAGQTAYTDALDAAGHTYGVWPADLAQIEADDLRTVCIVVWNTTSIPSDADRAALTPFLDRGGKLFIAGLDIASGLSAAGGPAAAWLENYLGVNFDREVPLPTVFVVGETGDPIGDGISIDSSAMTGADILSPRPGSLKVLYYGMAKQYVAGVRSDTYKRVFLGFNLDQLAGVADRDLLMTRIIDWLELCPGCAAGPPGRVASLMAHRSGGDIVFGWDVDPAAENGYNLYGTDDGSQVGGLRTGGGCPDCTPLFNAPGSLFTYTNGVSQGPTYYQALSVCGGVTEGPN